MSNAPDPFEFVKQLWGQMAVPGFGFTAGNAGGGAGMSGLQMPSFDPKELEKRLAELKQVKQWLEMNLNMMSLQINTIEMQLAGMAGLKAASTKAFSGSASENVGGNHSPDGSPAQSAPWMDPQSWMKLMQTQAAATQKAMEDGARAMQDATRFSAKSAAKPEAQGAARAAAAAAPAGAPKRAPRKKKS